MEQSFYIPTKGGGRIHQKENPKEEGLSILKATYIAGKKILIMFSNGKSKMVDFEPIFRKYVKGEFSVFAERLAFKKFKVAGGNIFWGKNEDVIFPAQTLYDSKHSKLVEEEILYVL